jgi:hypothetical protein
MTSCATVNVLSPHRAAFFALKERIARSVRATTYGCFYNYRLSNLFEIS